MKRLLFLLFAAAMAAVICTGCNKEPEKSPQTNGSWGKVDDYGMAIKQATGTIIGSYSNGFGSLLLQVDEDFPIGGDIEYVAGACTTLPNNGKYQNMIQVQINPSIPFSEIANHKISFSYRDFSESKDEQLFVVGNGVGNTFCGNPDIPIYVITDYTIEASEKTRAVEVDDKGRDYYWSGGQKIWLDKDYSQMVIGFSDDQDMKAFATDEFRINAVIGKSVAVVQVSDAATQKLSANSTIKNRIFAHKFADSDIPFYLTGDIIMQPKEGVSAQDILAEFGVQGEVIKETETGIVIVRLENWDTILSSANTIYESGKVDWCHPDFITPIERNAADPMFSQQYYLKNTGLSGGTSGIDLNVEPVWPISTGSGIRVAVIDDGVEDHDELSGKVLQGYTPLNPTGYGKPTTQVVPGVTIGHGQACAGIIAASHNTSGIAGVAPNVKIVPINIFHTWTYNTSTGGYTHIESTANIGSAIEYAWNPSKGGADVISNSWGYPARPANADYITQEISNAATRGRGGKGCVIVFASGNDHPAYGVSYPAQLDNVMSVGAINRHGAVWYYSARGSELDVVAVSGDINMWGDVITIDRMGSNGYSPSNYMPAFGGTSAAAPQVAGVAALMLSVYPNLTRQEVESAIMKSGALYPSRTNELGYGLVDAYAALVAPISGIFHTGSTIDCVNTTFSLPELPSFVTNITWRGSSGIQIVSGQGTRTVTFRKKVGSSETSSTLYVDLRLSNGRTITRSSMPMASAPAAVTSISVEGSGRYFTVVANPFVAVSQYEWRASGGQFVNQPGTGDTARWPQNYISFSGSGSYYVEARVNNRCGTSSWTGTTITVY